MTEDSNKTDITPAPPPPRLPVTRSECAVALAHLAAARDAEYLAYDLRCVDPTVEPDTPPGWRARCRDVPMTSQHHQSPTAAWGTCVSMVRDASLKALRKFVLERAGDCYNAGKQVYYRSDATRTLDQIAKPQEVRISIEAAGTRFRARADQGDAVADSVGLAIEQAFTAGRKQALALVELFIKAVMADAPESLDPTVPCSKYAQHEAIAHKIMTYGSHAYTEQDPQW